MQKIILDKKYFTLISDLQHRHILKVRHEEKNWIVCKVEQDIYIMAGLCPHAGASLSEGVCNIRGIVVCPLHGYKFDITKGRSADGHHYTFKSYRLKKSEQAYFFEL